MAREERERVMDCAVALYREELEKPTSSRKGLRTICKQVQDEYLKSTKTHIHINPTTLGRRAKGGKSMAQVNAEKGWLTDDEAEMVIQRAVDLAKGGYPLSHRRLKEFVDDVLRMRLGDAFPPHGVGKNWTDRFVEKHSARLDHCFFRIQPIDTSAHGLGPMALPSMDFPAYSAIS
ncbi:hypothetical protein SERLA73DRAFT_140731 [Serpula lacrymans var. lacrymans S7.3]|uniref:HTH CENPB-type domain-containing protein n=2 Tax=Serpula lacrymans var. lacrymans TaxID=341189 RepID=F8Q439_SERL3|nr:uncharacterized protein SERLADRAFT_395824 [Serpula lacrymans var. lacrymans S7.9]EGN96895.1 hypothetical protein SERLA73DRAFT_140731 [Serpula lacrymans var. lacrymans S7.3]EGO22493.1 hypothetical protein SERLADRAFT_395824 [Serpula lacrymans var. lacrymans S7.9]